MLSTILQTTAPNCPQACKQKIARVQLLHHRRHQTTATHIFSDEIYTVATRVVRGLSTLQAVCTAAKLGDDVGVR